MAFAPVVLFVYNRPSHTLQTLTALSENELAKDTVLYVYADGAKEGSSSEQFQRIREVRDLVKSKPWCKEVILIERNTNKGLAGSIIEGVTEVVNNHGNVIVLEDDLLTSRFFLKYMHEALDMYESKESVISISGYTYPMSDLPELYFNKGANCWGWATWKRGWDLFEPDGEKLLAELEKVGMEHVFDLHGSYGYKQMLQDQIEGKNNSWAIRWYASAFLKNKFTLNPGKSLVQNIGFDGTGTHCGDAGLDGQLSQSPVRMRNIPVKETRAIRIKLFKLFKEQGYPGYNEQRSGLLKINDYLNFIKSGSFLFRLARKVKSR